MEGFEWEVFSGMLKVLKNYSPILIIEHSPPHLKKRKMPLDIINKLLCSAGYNIYSIYDF